VISEVTETKGQSETSSFGEDGSPARSSDTLKRRLTVGNGDATQGEIQLAGLRGSFDEGLQPRACGGEELSEPAGSSAEASKSLTPHRPREMSLQPRHIVITPKRQQPVVQPAMTAARARNLEAKEAQRRKRKPQLPAIRAS
jgi:hypothetical protein